jgi:DNA-binding CsgD family transcriptional regulator/tetratricopeptide (TPR) repeat protein
VLLQWGRDQRRSSLADGMNDLGLADPVESKVSAAVHRANGGCRRGLQQAEAGVLGRDEGGVQIAHWGGAARGLTAGGGKAAHRGHQVGHVLTIEISLDEVRRVPGSLSGWLSGDGHERDAMSDPGVTASVGLLIFALLFAAAGFGCRGRGWPRCATVGATGRHWGVPVAESETAVIGRELELATVQQVLVGMSDGAGSLVVQGLPGIGKTVIWAAAVSAARDQGVVVRECRCAQADSTMAFAGLGDLFDSLDPAILDSLPAVQRHALSAALLLDQTGVVTGSERVVGVAVLGVLRSLAADTTLVLAIDDVQWLDPSSRSALTFALRRLRDEPIGLIASYRLASDEDTATDADLGLSGDRLTLGPVSVGDIRALLRSRLSLSVTRSTLTRVYDATGGNPMAGLEIGRALQRWGREPSAGEPLPVPTDLRALVADRLSGLNSDTRELLLVCAAVAQPTVALVLSTGDPDRMRDALDEAESARVLTVEGDRVRFTHPLLASVPYADLAPVARRRLHLRLAGIVTEPEEHARHAALGADGPDPAVAAALELAAQHASDRGSAAAGAELAELAVTGTPEDCVDDLQRRHFDAAERVFRLGEPVRAWDLALGGLELTAAGVNRVRGLLLLATIAYWTQGDEETSRWCRQALAEAGTDPLLLSRCYLALADMTTGTATASLAQAHTAVALLEQVDSPPLELLASALKVTAYHELRAGNGLSRAALERAVELDASAPPVPVLERAGMVLGMLLRFACCFDEARTHLHEMRRSAEDEGDDGVIHHILGHLALLDCWAGDYDSAIASARTGRELMAETGMGSPSVTSAHSLAEAHLGHLDAARQMATLDLGADEAQGELAGVACQLRSLGFIELSSGNLDAAAAHLLRALELADRLGGEPAVLRVHGDAVEALIGSGQRDEAERLTEALERSTASGLPWSMAVAGRCRGLLAAHDDQLTQAVGFLEQSVTDHERVPMPFERARTMLALGVALRRSRRNRAAREVLDNALLTFTELRTPVFARRARDELARIGGRVGDHMQLTATESRVADLVAAGSTNREVADSLVISVRTVETHLSHVYRKLDVRSRTELARRIS